MDRFLHSLFPHSRCKQSTFQLACAWIIGLIAGIFLQTSSEYRCAWTLADRGSLAIQLAVTLLPLLCSALAAYVGCPKLVIAIAFIKAFLFTYVGIGVLLSWGSAGWLIRLLMMFSDTLILPLLWWYWLSILDHHRILTFTAAAVLPAFAIICFDSYVISPVLANLT